MSYNNNNNYDRGYQGSPYGHTPYGNPPSSQHPGSGSYNNSPGYSAGGPYRENVEMQAYSSQNTPQQFHTPASYQQPSPQPYSGAQHTPQPYSGAQHAPQPYSGGQTPLQQSTSDDDTMILDQCQDIDNELNRIRDDMSRLQRKHRARLDLSGSEQKAADREVSAIGDGIYGKFKPLVGRVRELKSSPSASSARNSSQIGRVERRLRETMEEYSRTDMAFRKDLAGATRRQYLLVNPDATEEELREVTEDPEGQVFQRELINKSKHGAARSVLDSVKSRHAAIQKAEQQMVEISKMFEELDMLVQAQDPVVEQVEQQMEEVEDNMEKGNVELGVGIEKARAARKKKWWCLGIAVTIVVIIAIVLLVYFLAIRNNNNK